jgi:HK97 family phage major capsid protein
MKEKLKALLESYETKIKEQKALYDKQDASQEDIVNANTMNAELDKLEGEIKTLKEAEGFQSQNAARFAETQRAATGTVGNVDIAMRPAGEAQVTNNIGNKKGGLHIEQIGEGMMSDKTFKAIRQDEYKQAFFSYLRKAWSGLSNSEQKVLQEGIDDQGGYFVPFDLMNTIIARKPTPTRVAGNVFSINTTRDALTIPQVVYTTDDIYTTGIRVNWTGEVPASSSTTRVSTEPVFGQVTIPIFTAMMSMPITNDLLEDSEVALMPWLESKFQETIDILYDDMILNGTGIGKPMGILANPDGTGQVASVVTGAASTLTLDGLLDLTEALPEQYDMNAQLIFNKTNTGKAIRKLKDGEGRPIVSNGFADMGYAGGRYNEVNGYPFIWSGLMPNVGASTFPIIFGDLMGYYLVRRVGFSVRVLNELLAETNQQLLLGRIRFGGLNAEPWRMRCQKVST